MQSSRRSAALAAVLLLVASLRSAQARPALDDQAREEDFSAEPTVRPDSLLDDFSSDFGEMLRSRLQNLPEPDLAVLEAGIPPAPGTGNGDPGDVMMGDEACAPDGGQQPQPQQHADWSGSATPSEIQREIRESSKLEKKEEMKYLNATSQDKNYRILEIKKNVMNMINGYNRGLKPNPMVPVGTMSSPTAAAQRRDAVNILYKDVNNFPTIPTDSITEKTQSFYSSCIRPRNTSEIMWNSKESMNLMFNLNNLPKTDNNILVNVTSAKLRLYKHLILCTPQSSNETDDSRYCQPPKSEEIVKKPNASSEEMVLGRMEDRQIRVSIYMYTRKLNKKRVKRKLLDSRMIPYYSEKWTEWNIRSAAKIWHQEPLLNYGMSVEVEDEDGNLLPAYGLFKPMNCTGNSYTTTPKPVPGFLTEAVDYGYGLQLNPAAANNLTLNALNFNTVHRYPILDVTTASESEVIRAQLYERTKLMYEQGLAKATQMSGIVTKLDEPTQHRTRHHHRNGTADVQQTLAPGLMDQSPDGHELRDQMVEKHVIFRSVHKPQQLTLQSTEPPDYN